MIYGNDEYDASLPPLPLTSHRENTLHNSNVHKDFVAM